MGCCQTCDSHEVALPAYQSVSLDCAKQPKGTFDLSYWGNFKDNLSVKDIQKEDKSVCETVHPQVKPAVTTMEKKRTIEWPKEKEVVVNIKKETVRKMVQMDNKIEKENAATGRSYSHEECKCTNDNQAQAKLQQRWDKIRKLNTVKVDNLDHLSKAERIEYKWANKSEFEGYQKNSSIYRKALIIQQRWNIDDFQKNQERPKENKSANAVELNIDHLGSLNKKPVVLNKKKRTLKTFTN